MLDDLKRLLRSTTTPAKKLGSGLADAARLAADAAATVAKFEAVCDADILDDEAVRAANRKSLAEARDKLESATRLVGMFQTREAELVAAAEQQRRRDVYDAARRKTEAASKALTSNYPRLCADLLALIKTLSEAQLAARGANAELPEGAMPVPDPEHAARWIDSLNRETVGDEELEKWVRIDQDRPVPDEFHDDIYEVGKGRGKRPNDLQPCYVRAIFRRHEFREMVAGSYPVPLAAMLRLPALKGDGLIWGTPTMVGFDPVLSGHLGGEFNPAATLHRVAEMEAQPLVQKPVVRSTRIEWTLLRYIDTAPGSEPAESYSAERSVATRRG